MIFDKNREKAEKGEIGICPLCDSELVAKCGDINIHHWAHKIKSDCPYTGEGETRWHLEWKENFNIDDTEIVLIKNEVKKISDLTLNIEGVDNFYEFQNSPIDNNEINLRNKHYGNLIWIFNCEEQFKKDFIFYVDHKKVYSELIMWKHAKKYTIIEDDNFNYILDFGNDLLFFVSSAKKYKGRTNLLGFSIFKKDLINNMKNRNIIEFKYEKLKTLKYNFYNK